MRSRSKILAERSLQSILSAIEIYNKPTFPDREQIFAVLIAIGWEVLLKARVLQINGNRLSSIYVKDGRRFKSNRVGTPMTVDIFYAIRTLQLDPVVSSNIERLVEIRDAAVHLTAQSQVLPQLLYNLGAAALQNYCRLATDWFGFDLAKYNFFILPLGFSYPFSAFKLAQMSKEPADILKIVQLVQNAQDAGKEESDGFRLVCEIQTQLISAKKITSKADLTAAIAQTGDTNISIVQKRTSKIHDFPHSYKELWEKVRATMPKVQQSAMNSVIRDLQIRGDNKHSAYSYRNKRDEERGPQKSTPVIYNDAAFSLIISRLEKKS